MLRAISDLVTRKIIPRNLRYRFARSGHGREFDHLAAYREQSGSEHCPCCRMPLVTKTENHLTMSHNVRTCQLVNLALANLGISLDQCVQVRIYPYFGPLKGYYSPANPFTIHISEEMYQLFPEYVIFHETKHLVDCLGKGWSEESSPDPFARELCGRYGFRCPPPHQSVAMINLTGVQMSC